MAQTLLNRALLLNSADARPYLWLSTTTDDPEEQREYLEKAVAADPTNAAARRGLAMLTGKIHPSRLLEHDAAPEIELPEGELEAQGQTFLCPQCGGRLAFSVSRRRLTCEYCGYEGQGAASQDSGSDAGQAGQMLDFVMPTSRGHRWAVAQHRLICESCGAVSVLPPGHKAAQCAYCGSNQMVESQEGGELIGPQVIALMRLDEPDAIQRARAWLGKGFFAPDNLLPASGGVRLRPGYYSCWVFDGVVEVHWSCEVNEGSGDFEHWVSRSGVEPRFFDQVLVSGVKTLSARELSVVEPFDLEDVEAFKPEYLAGWPAILYDRSISDASLLAREQVMKQLRPQIHSVVEIGREKRNLRIGGGSWSGLTYRHILLPLWIGAYRFRGKEYHLLVNGQTGKVGGDKPRDVVKLVFVFFTAVLLVFLLLVLYWSFTGAGWPF